MTTQGFVMKHEDKIDVFKSATAATLRAMAEKKHMDVSYSSTEDAARPSPPSDQASRLPIPNTSLDANALALIRGVADSKALRLRHSNHSLHLKNAPMSLLASTSF